MLFVIYLNTILCIIGVCTFSCLESLFVGSKPMVALSLMELPGDARDLVLAMGGLDNKIHLYCGRTEKVCGASCMYNFHSTLYFNVKSFPIC